MRSRLHSMQQLDMHWQQLYGQQGQGLPDVFGDTRSMLAHLTKVAQEKAGEQRLEAAKVLNKPIDDWEVELALKKSHSGRAPGPDGLLSSCLLLLMGGTVENTSCCLSCMPY